MIPQRYKTFHLKQLALDQISQHDNRILEEGTAIGMSTGNSTGE